MRRFALCALLTCIASTAAAAPPTIDFIYPAGGQQGADVSVTIGGKSFNAWPLQAWTDSAGLKFQPAAEKGAFVVHIDKDVAPGPHVVRFYDAQGAATPRVFVVGTQRELAEAEPNDEVGKAQPAGELPVTVNGRLEKSGDVDSYAVKLQAGQTLVAAVVGRRAGAPIDPLLHLCDAEGNEIAFVHDGLGLDPLLVHRAERSGTYVVRVSAFAFPPAADVKLTGGPACVYRLSLGTGPLVRCAMPAGVRRGTKARVQLYDWNGTQEGRDVDATGAAPAEDAITVAEDVRVALGDWPELTEPEARSALPLSIPAAVTGRIDHDGEEDVYQFTAKKDQRLMIEAHSVALASPMDAVLRVEDEAGKALASDDDKGDGSDAQLQWTAPADGTYRAVVGDRFSRGGAEQVYRLVIRPDAPAATGATLDGDEYKIEPGKTTPIKLTVARGADAPAGILVAVATGLPPGVTGSSAEVGEKGGAVSLTLTAAADVKPFSGPVRVMLLATDAKHPAAWTATCSLRKEGGQELIPRTDTAWLTVSASK